MGADNGFDTIGDEFARNQRKLHALMIHRESIRHGQRKEFSRCAASPRNANFGCRRLGGEGRLHGVISPAVLTTPIKGRAIAASSNPMARRKARCGARSKPSVVKRDRRRAGGRVISLTLHDALLQICSQTLARDSRAAERLKSRSM